MARFKNGFFLLVLGVSVVGCFNFSANRTSKEANLAFFKEKAKILSSISPEERQARFARFIDQLYDSNIIEPRDSLFKESRLFFPDTTLRDSAYLFAKPFAQKGDIQLILFEFTSTNSSNTWFNLGSFKKDGQPIDLVQVIGKSNDANLSINILEDEIIAFEYIDFYLSPQYFETSRYQNAPDSIKAILNQHHTAIQDYVWKKDYAETSYYENFRLDEYGFFQEIKGKSLPSLERQYPFASTRILSKEELAQYSKKQLRYMKLEIYADYGKKFKNPKIRQIFTNKSWYLPTYNNIDIQLSEIEKINIQRIDQIIL